MGQTAPNMTSIDAPGPSGGKLTVITADALREMEGVNISQALSWERTAKDFSYAIRTLDQFSQCPYLIVLFGTDGAILYRNERGQSPEAVLVFDPFRLEDEFWPVSGTDDSEFLSVFTESLGRHVADHKLDGLEGGIAKALAVARNRLSGDDSERVYQFCEIEPAEYGDDPDPHYWRIVDQQTRNTRLLVAEEIVLRGNIEGLDAVPRGKFGALETIDRAEIESYGAIRGLLSEYIEHPDPPRPLCIAVFGPPGAGKSFGVKQVMKSLNATGVTAKTYNISQYERYAELASALHEVKDIAKSGELPFVFFDEFDATLNKQPLGWLASFLAPMNDSEFKDGDEIYPIGKSIFVFAGATASTFAQFSERTDQAFVEVKGPDFVSRLRGFVNVMGPNRQHVNDDAYILRRAIVLRSNFVRNAKTCNLLDEDGRVRIDPGVLRAMLHVSSYRHGMRSMEALLDMSRIGKERRFNLAALPPKLQLDLQVDAEEFLWLTQCERYQTIIPPHQWIDSDLSGRIELEAEIVERVAGQIFTNVIKNRRLEGKDIRLPGEWAAVSDEEKQSFRDSAIDMPNKLRAINHGIRRIPDDRSANVPDISDSELDALVRLEHNRRCQYLRLNGYSFAETTDKVARKSSRLVPIEELPPDRVNHYLHGIYAIPVVLQALGYEIYRMEEHSIFTDDVLVDTLARLIHEDYVDKELEKGESKETNMFLLPYDELPQDKIDSNTDNARSIPRKLRRIGYHMARLRAGESASTLELADDQVIQLAEMEHSRWVWQMLMQGWIYKAGKKNLEAKTNPCILPWSQLTDEVKQFDIDTVSLIPTLLTKAGYTVKSRR